MIPTFNCAAHLRETLASVLAQDPGPEVMQIEVVDDHSTRDDPRAVVEELGGGRIEFFRQSANVGHTRNFETCLRRSRGHLVHLLHGDDLVRPGFYARMQSAFDSEPSIGAAFCRQIFLDERGHWRSLAAVEQQQAGILDRWLERLAEEQRIMTPSIVVRREVYEALGGFDERLICAEDWEMWVRIAACYPIWYEPEPLAVYRMHFDSNTGRHVRSGEDITYTSMAIDIFSAYLPDQLAGPVVRRAKRAYAREALDMAHRMYRAGDAPATRAQMRAAWQCSRSVRTLPSWVRFAARVGRDWVAAAR
jgi:glycosyltransferase involved in cell wall biosynthesis